MKATGIVRRIGDMGRVVIPKEIRRTMDIKEGDPLGISSTNGFIVVKKMEEIDEPFDASMYPIRRIDDLGRVRVFIPKEITSTMDIKEGDPLEFYTDKDKILLKRYQVIEEENNEPETTKDNKDIIEVLLLQKKELLSKRLIEYKNALSFSVNEIKNHTDLENIAIQAVRHGIEISQLEIEILQLENLSLYLGV